MSLNFFPSRSKTLSCDVAFCSYCANNFPPNTAAPSNTASDLRNDFFPRVAIEVAGIGDEHAIAWRIFVGRDVHLAVVDFRVVEEILSRGQPGWRIFPTSDP